MTDVQNTTCSYQLVIQFKSRNDLVVMLLSFMYIFQIKGGIEHRWGNFEWTLNKKKLNKYECIII